MDEYFVSAPPAVSREDVEQLDLSGMHQPFRPPRSLLVLSALGKVLMGLVLLAAAAAPLLLVVALFRFLDSLPF